MFYHLKTSKLNYLLVELGDIEIFMDDISLNKIPRYYLISQYLQL